MVSIAINSDERRRINLLQIGRIRDSVVGTGASLGFQWLSTFESTQEGVSLLGFYLGVLFLCFYNKFCVSF